MTISKPISVTGNLNAALGTNQTDVGRLCVHQNINIWAKCKPVRSSVITELTEQQRKDANYGMLFSYFAPACLMTVYEGGYITYREEDVSPAKWADYLRPRTSAQDGDRYRLLDFDGYDNSEQLPLRLVRYDNVFNRGNEVCAYAFFDENAQGGSLLNYADLEAVDGQTEYAMGELYVGMAMFIRREVSGRDFFLPVSVGIGYWLFGSTKMWVKLKDMLTVREEDEDLPPSMIGKKWMEYNLDASRIPSALEDIDNNPCKYSRLYLRPLLSPVDGQHLTWSEGAYPVSSASFLPLRTPGDIVNDIKINVRNQIFIYCAVTRRFAGYSEDEDELYEYRFDFRVGNCYPYTEYVQKIFDVIQVQVRMYPTYQDLIADPNPEPGHGGTGVDPSLYACDLTLSNYLDIESPYKYWELKPWDSRRPYPDYKWRNDFSHYSLPSTKYTLKLGNHVHMSGKSPAPYRYFQSRLNFYDYNPNLWSGVTPQIIFQNGLYNNNEITVIETV